MKKDEEKKTTQDAPEIEDVQPLTTDDLIEKLAQMQQREDAANAKAKEMTDMAQRIQAEFDNYRKRTLDNTRKAREDGAVDVIMKLIPLTDVLTQALAMITDEAVKKGVVMIESEIIKLLAAYNVTEIEAEGKEFDPHLHEAVMQATAEKPQDVDTVKQVFQKGYIMGERVIRPARVIVNK